MFELQALKAKHGDCLLLHWDHEGERKLALIDGGPAGVYQEYLKPALIDLAESQGDRLVIHLMMLSHIDDDHVNGLLDLSNEIENRNPDLPRIRVANLWHNSLEGLLAEKLSGGETASVLASAQNVVTAGLPDNSCKGEADRFYSSKVLASVPQGQQLHGYAKRLDWTMNRGFRNPPLVISQNGRNKIDFHGLSITVVAPAIEEVEKLRQAWVEKRVDEATAAYRDRSVFNLSSIVVLVEREGKSLLLTGDARGDHIIKGLERCGLLVDGKFHVNVLKLPHHGSKNNVEPDFYERITADHYVVSGDQIRFPNPSMDSMQWLSDSQEGRNYKVHCTYPLEELAELFGENFVGPADDNSVSVDMESV